MTDRTKQKIKNFWTNKITLTCTIVTIIVACFTISYYSWTTFSKAKDISDTPQKLTAHVTESKLLFETHCTAQKESFQRIDTIIKDHISEQSEQFLRLEQKLESSYEKMNEKMDRKFDEQNKKFDEINNKLFEIAKSFNRVETARENERKVQASLITKNNNKMENEL